MVRQLISKETLGELVAEQLRRSIWNRTLQFGERLIEDDLSKKYGVSRNAIKDALIILEHEEMIVTKPRRGTYVASFTQQDWHEIIELRTLVESFSFVKALSFLEEKHFEQLKDILTEMKETSANENWSDLYDLDMQFHIFVVNLSGNSRVIKLYESIQVQIRTFLLYLDKYYSSHQSFYEEHKELFEALLTKDPKIVDEKIRKHIEYVEGEYLAHV